MQSVKKNEEKQPLCKDLTRVYLIMLLITVLIFITIILLRGVPIGMDPFYFMHYAGSPQDGFPTIFFSIINMIPWQVICVTSLVTFITLTWLFAKHFNLPEPELAALLTFAAPVTMFRFMMPEDDIIGILLGWAFIYFILKKRYCIAALTAILGLLTWKAFPLFLIYPIVSWLAKKFYPFVASGAAALLATGQLNTQIGENMLGLIALPSTLFGLLIGLKGIKDAPQELKTLTFYFGLMALVSAKFIWLAVLPLALCLSLAIKGMENKDFAIIVLVGIGLIYGSFFAFNAPPTHQQVTDIQEIANITQGELIANEWQWGHWLRYWGANPTTDNAHPDSVYTIEPNATWCLHNKPLHVPVAKNFSWVVLYHC